VIDGNPSGTAAALRAPSRPIFVIGVPRSGTTVVFNCFAARPDVAWFPQHLNRVPRWPSVTLLARLVDRFPSVRKSIRRSDHSRRWREKARIGPVEAYPIWEHYAGSKFLYESLLGVRPTADESAGLRRLVSKLQRYQGKDRFATKITGPARIGFLTGAFPDAFFVNVIRDGRAVSRSLTKVDFFKDTWRETSVSWEGVLGDVDLDRWQALGKPPLALAALQWQALIQAARGEAKAHAPDRYAEVRYEDFVADPHEMIDEIARFCGLPVRPEPHEFLRARVEVRDMNRRSVDLSPSEQSMFDDLIGVELAELGYIGGEPGERERPLLSRPFAGG